MKLESLEEDGTPHLGSGAGDPRLAKALLTRFRDVQEWPYAPGAIVALPVADMEFPSISDRQVSSPLAVPEECAKWTDGMWSAVLGGYNASGVQMAVTELESPVPGSGTQHSRRREGSSFSEAIITGPAAMLVPSWNPNLPVRCRHLPDAGFGSGDIEHLARLTPG